MKFISEIFINTWQFLLEAAPYVLFGLLVSGLLRVFLSPDAVFRQLGRDRFKSVFKAAVLGIPLPLCSCGVLPAAVSLRKQGANTGATTAFLISTPESGVDSISMTYALLDPLMTVARPVAAFFTAAAAGIAENIFSGPQKDVAISRETACPVDGCCDGNECPPELHGRHHGLGEKVFAGFRYAAVNVWGDMFGWFWLGLFVAGLITALIPDAFFARYLGGGLDSMLIMLAMGIPLYICATASTPIAAALILKGVSPGAALVFLLAGPATNITSLTVLLGTLGKRATAIYLLSIALFAVCFGLILDQVYGALGFEPRALLAKAGEFIPEWVEWGGALILVLLSLKPLFRAVLNPVKDQKSSESLTREKDPFIRAPQTSPCTKPT